jgi:putative ABC transport system substrate-binding protein
MSALNRLRRLVFASPFAMVAGTSASTPRLPRVVIAASNREALAKLFAEVGVRDGRDAEVGGPSRARGEPRSRRGDARELLAEKPDVILVPGGHLPFALRDIGGTIPVVFASLGADPVKLGLVQSLRRPGGNITGTHEPRDRSHREIMGSAHGSPSRRRSIGSLFARGGFDSTWAPLAREAAAAAGSQLKLRVAEIPVDPAGPSPASRKDVLASGVELLDITGGNWPWIAELMRFLERRSIPAHWEVPSLVRRGGLLSLIGNIQEATRAAVQIVARILKGRAARRDPGSGVERGDPGGQPAHRPGHGDHPSAIAPAAGEHGRG